MSLLDTLKQLEGKSITIGIHGSEGEQKKLVRVVPANVKTQGKQRFAVSKSITVGEVANWNEKGTERTPSRPFIRGTFTKRRRDILDKAKQILLKSPEHFHALLGTYIVGLIKEEIAAGISPANSPLTVIRKGSSKPLIDSGQMINAITYKVQSND